MPLTERYHPDPRHLALGGAFYDPVSPAPFPAAVLRWRNDRWAPRVGLDGLDEVEWIERMARFAPLPGNIPQPLALRYHGHQFQNYNPEIGDGRGFLYAQMRDAEDGRLLDLGTKGSGRTPWSRFGDGRLTLKGGVREVLATEMLEALGVYTSKSFSLIETGEALARNDEPSPTRSSVLVRLSHSHVRIGSFQRFLYLNEGENIEWLLDYCIETYWPQAAQAENRAVAFLALVTDAVARMAAEWFQAGFVHGVLNTDNTTITGESFDYGPWRFLPTLDTAFTAAYFDQTGLYAFGRQPAALHWNLCRLADSLRHLAPDDALVSALTPFGEIFDAHLSRLARARLALDPDDPGSEDAPALVYRAMARTEVPFECAMFDLVGGADPARLAASPHAALYRDPEWEEALAAVRAARPHPRRDEALAHPYFSREAPVTMLIEDVEAVWAAIAEGDDWGVFAGKVDEVGEMRGAHAPLLSAMRRDVIP
ncbi:protein adenylyltransferase SelO family protein [Salinarimonas chemoclinalis]|uniref:protein adenylyltransferase SelO family protein n=1 Tax=Salinarimonas chemoclinalis TaxID=3241599 RepID=UPI003558C7DF